MKTVREALLSEKDEQLLSQLRAIVNRHLPDAKLILFGSVARGEQEPDSDYDIYVITSGQVPQEQKRAIQADVLDLELEADALIMLMFCVREWWEQHPRMPLHREIQRDGVVL